MTYVNLFCETTQSRSDQRLNVMQFGDHSPAIVLSQLHPLSQYSLLYQSDENSSTYIANETRLDVLLVLTINIFVTNKFYFIL